MLGPPADDVPGGGAAPALALDLAELHAEVAELRDKVSKLRDEVETLRREFHQAPERG